MGGAIATTKLGSETRGEARISDLTYEGRDGQPVSAYLVTPEGPAAATPAAPSGAAVLAWHWLDTEAPDGDRTHFLDEAVELAGLGVTSLLPQGRFPWSIAPSRTSCRSSTRATASWTAATRITWTICGVPARSARAVFITSTSARAAVSSASTAVTA